MRFRHFLLIALAACASTQKVAKQKFVHLKCYSAGIVVFDDIAPCPVTLSTYSVTFKDIKTRKDVNLQANCIMRTLTMVNGTQENSNEM